MNLTVLGSNASGPSPGNPASGYLVQAADTAVWMDCGPGTFAELGKRADPAGLDAVVISHRHVDHCADLLGLYSYLAYGVGASSSVPVYAPPGLREVVAGFVGAGDDHVLHRVLEFHDIEPGDAVEVGGLSVQFGQAVHPVPAVVTRIDEGRSRLVYSGDTGPGGDLIELATGVELLLCEATLQGTRDASTYAYHLTAREAGEIAAIAGASVLAVTHIPFTNDPQLTIDQASSAFAGPIEYALPGTTFTTE
ncbi:MAG: MBL fold metallo-hydrolase [Acidimicrobiia bacterium]